MQYLTRQGSIYERSRLIEEPIDPAHYNEYLSAHYEYPGVLLLKVHPLTDEILRAADKRKLGIEDARWRFDRQVPKEHEQMRRRDYILSFADTWFGGMEALWDDFYRVAKSWGALAGQYWPLRRQGQMEKAWRNIPDSEKIRAETEFMIFLGIAKQYPSRLTRKVTIFDHVQRWLNHEFSSRILESPTLRDEIAAITSQRLHVKTCEICGRRYQEMQFGPYWLEQFVVFEGCCLGCPLEVPTARQLPLRVRNLVDACGFVPPAGSIFEDRAFMRRIEPSRFIATARAYAALGGLQPAIDKYGSWMKAVIDSGAVGDQAWPTPRGVRCIAADGHECLSLDERTIDNWLHEHGVAHDKEPKYPQHPEFNGKSRLRADWKAGETYIEYFGLAGEEKYDAKVKRKLDLVEAYGLDLIPIYYSDMSRLETLLSRLVPKRDAHSG